MSKKIEKMRWRAEDRIYNQDEWVRQDNEELLLLEQKLEDLDLTEKEREVIDNYIACRESREDRMGYLLYKAGMKDTKRKIKIRKTISRLVCAAAVGTVIVILHEKKIDTLHEIKTLLQQNKIDQIKQKIYAGRNENYDL